MFLFVNVCHGFAGCDSLVSVILTVFVNGAVSAGTTFPGYLWASVMLVAFFSGQWQEVHTGEMHTNIGKVDDEKGSSWDEYCARRRRSVGYGGTRRLAEGRGCKAASRINLSAFG